MNSITTPPSPMPDVQGSEDRRQIAIGRVGVRAVRYPVTLGSATKVSASEHPNKQHAALQSTVGCFHLDVALPAHKKGAHMSRFIELLEEENAPLNWPSFANMLTRMLTKLEAYAGRIEVSFPYFIRKAAPVSGVESVLDYDVTLIGEVEQTASDKEAGSKEKTELRFFLQVQVPVTSLCPCSKKISKYGAHNQRSHVNIKAQLCADASTSSDPDASLQTWIQRLVSIAEEEASCALWGVLKRPDEKFVTERAYENPKFVEDLVRDIAVRLNQDSRILAYTLDAENFESIHNHSAYARIESGF